MKRVVLGLGYAWIIACSSGTGDAGAGDAGTGGNGGSGGSDCNSTPCFAPARCVKKCGDTPVDYGCCGCPSDMIDVSSCPDDAGSDAAADASCQPELADAGSVACGSQTCGPNQICVNPCCGGAPLPDGGSCELPPPFCVDASEISCCSGSSSCTDGSTCSGFLSGQQLACMCA